MSSTPNTGQEVCKPPPTAAEIRTNDPPPETNLPINGDGSGPSSTCVEQPRASTYLNFAFQSPTHSYPPHLYEIEIQEKDNGEVVMAEARRKFSDITSRFQHILLHCRAIKARVEVARITVRCLATAALARENNVERSLLTKFLG